jgi:hypothetical protein
LLAVVILGTLLPSPALAQGRIRVEAFLGEPFGVGRLEIDLPESSLPTPLGQAGLGLSEKNARLIYPAMENRPLAGAVRDLLGRARRPGVRMLGELIDRPGKTNLYFLFTGRDTLDITLSSQRPESFFVRPVADPQGFRRTLNAWWRHYSAATPLLQKSMDYPPLVDNYLKSMLSRRLELPSPSRPRDKSWQLLCGEELALTSGSESLRIAIQRDRFLHPAAAEKADQPLPASIDEAEIDVPDSPADAQIEPLAMRVPRECLYVRFGSYSHFLWLQDTLAQWNGDFQNLVASRGLDRGVTKRFETQLAVQNTVLARLLGDTVIADVAMIGTDFFIQEGGSYGLLFKAKSSAMLANDFNGRRKERLKATPGAKEETVTIAGQKVSFLSSPDGSVRSYYVVDGDYHLVTSSRWIVERFLATRDGKGSLGASREFRFARTQYPLTRNDTVFVYLSSAFFRNYISPAYRIEMTRRVQALADIELAQLAVLASATENKPGKTIEQLIAGEFLPPGFGIQPDGSRIVFERGEFRDSARGHRGSFVPVPDMPVQQVSRSETEAYRQFGEFYRENWRQLDPLVVAIHRRPISEGRDEIVIDAKMTPLLKTQYEKISRWIGEPDSRQLSPVKGDLVAFELQMPRQRLFGGLQDLRPSAEIASLAILPLGQFRELLTGYVGSTGELGVLGSVASRMSGPADAAGYAYSELGLWRRDLEPFTVFSFQREVLDVVTPQLRFVEADRSGQFRLHVADVSSAQFAPVVHNWAFARTRATSLGNLRLLHQLTQQLHVPGEDALGAAELLLGAKLVCPLGGQYVYRKQPDGSGYWTSTALEGLPATRPLQTAVAPDGYQAPALRWLRGLDMDARMTPDAITAFARIDMQTSTTPKRPAEHVGSGASSAPVRDHADRPSTP